MSCSTHKEPCSIYYHTNHMISPPCLTQHHSNNKKKYCILNVAPLRFLSPTDVIFSLTWCLRVWYFFFNFLNLAISISTSQRLWCAFAHSLFLTPHHYHLKGVLKPPQSCFYSWSASSMLSRTFAMTKPRHRSNHCWGCWELVWARH